MSGPVRGSGAASKAALALLRTACRCFRIACGPRRVVTNGGLCVAPAPPTTARRRWNAPAPIEMLGSTLLFLFPAADSYAEQRIGRLFSSPEQRMELDRMRNDPGFGKKSEPAADRPASGSRSEPATASGSLPESAGARLARAVTLNGVVLRSDGHRVAWIDGVESATGTTLPAGVRIEAQRTPGGSLYVRLPEGRASAALKPGQTIDAKGRVREVYERRPTNGGPGTYRHDRTPGRREGP